MKRRIEQLPGGSLLVGALPLGCKLCTKGSKMILFVTGLCDSSCYYCPLSQEKTNKDVVYADEMPVSSIEDIFTEVDAIAGEGAGVSGGDPLCRLERTLEYISLLKHRYGPEFHIHLYTSKTSLSNDELLRLKNAGLDEIRFHPQTQDWTGIERAIALNLVVGIEVPAIPGQVDRLKKIARRAQKIGVSFFNINELEASETNFESLRSLGMRLTDLESASIEGSSTTAKEILDWAITDLTTLSVHFCSARYKDAVQMRNRLERRLEQTIREFEERDEIDPLLVLGVIRGSHGTQLNNDQLTVIYTLLKKELEIPENLLNIDPARKRIEIAPWILEEATQEIKKKLATLSNLEIGISYEYPSYDRLQTMFDPL
ncbi:MAG: radical SAM protein [Candidatus Thorarchaeota archaeon]|nr:radical SAM protein [Candidatus Thorarchaeota archaeon]